MSVCLERPTEVIVRDRSYVNCGGLAVLILFKPSLLSRKDGGRRGARLL